MKQNRKEIVMIEMSVDDLQTLIIDCVCACLRSHTRTQEKLIAEKGTHELLTVGEAAKLLATSKSQIYNYIRAGKLTRRYIGKSVRFSRDEVTKLAKNIHP